MSSLARSRPRPLWNALPRVTSGNRLVIPLRPSLSAGTYSVRWSVVSDDGHEEEGVLAFGMAAFFAWTSAPIDSPR